MSEFIMTPHPAVRLWGFFNHDGENVARLTLPESLPARHRDTNERGARVHAYELTDREVAEEIVRREGVEFDPAATESRPLLQGASGPHWEFHRIAAPYSMVVGNREIILPVGTLVQLHQMEVMDEEYPGDQFIEYGAVVRPVVSVPALDEWKGIYLAERGPVGDLWKNAPLLIPADRVQHARITNEGEVAKFLLTLKMLGLYWHLDDDPTSIREPLTVFIPTEIPALRERQREIWNVAEVTGMCPHSVRIENVPSL